MRCNDFRVWHETDMPTCCGDVRCSGKTGSGVSEPSGPLLTLCDIKRVGI